MGDFPGGPKVKTWPSNAGASDSIPGRGGMGVEYKDPHMALKPKNQNINIVPNPTLFKKVHITRIGGYLLKSFRLLTAD